MIGPAIQLVGFSWLGLHVLLSHHDTPLSARHLVLEPPLMVIFVGLLVSLICVPVALEVTRASEEELRIPVFGESAPAEAPATTSLASGPGGGASADH